MQPATECVISIVVPVFNEAPNLAAFYDRVTNVMVGLGEPYEIVFVNDGSKGRKRPES